jgi:hypothetical protein
MPLQIKKTDQLVEFSSADGKPCATYHYMDKFKSFFRGLYTPSGKEVVASPPPEHPHHKGLQFGLCTSEVNFWEEDKASEPPHNQLTIGMQHNTKLDLLTGSEIGFTQVIDWRTDTMSVLNETRTISVQETPAAYVWTWDTRLTAVAPDVQIVRSVWGAPGYCDPDFGYCGLGLRLAADVFQDGEVLPPQQCGSKPTTSISYQGKGAAVTFQQTAGKPNALFVSTYQNAYPYGPGGPGFAFLTFVPTPSELKGGETLELGYIVTVSDI